MVEHNIVRVGSPNIVMLLALGLALVGLAVVFTVFMAGAGAAAFKRQMKSALLTALMIAPALAVVGVVGVYFSRQPTSVIPSKQHADRSGRIKTVVTRRELVDHRNPRREMTAEAIVVSQSEATVLNTAEKASADSADVLLAPSPPTAPPAPSAPAAPLVAEVQINSSINDQSTTVAIAGMDLSRRPTGVLRVRETLPKEPDWAKTGPLPSDPGILVPLSSQRFATLGEAEVQVTQLAVGYLKKFYHDEYPLPGDFTVPVSLIERYGVETLVGEEQDKDFGNGFTGKMYRAHLRLDVNSKLRDALHESWNNQLVKQRLTNLGSGLGLVTMLLASAAGYFRLNEMTHGQYGSRLKLAAAALIGAAGLGVLALV